MNAIISFLINSILIFSFVFATLSVKAQDTYYCQIDYSAHLVDGDALAFFVPTIEKEVKSVNIEKPLQDLTPNAMTVTSRIETSAITPPKTRQMYGRETITFILGKDTDPANPFYEESFFYFANHPYDQTDFIITACRSLLDVRNYLASYPTGNALPWSTINIVISPNQLNDLRVPIFPQGTKSDVKNLEMIATQNNFPSLSSNQIDQRTTLYIHGAEVKKDSKLSYALHRLLFAKDNLAINPVFLDDSFALEN